MHAIGRSVIITGALFVFAIGEVCAEALVVDSSGATVEGVTAEYTGITLHGDYTIGAGASITNLKSESGTLLDIGPNEGDDVTMKVTGGGQFVGSGTAQKAPDSIVIGRNGGRGRIIVQDVTNPSDPKRNKSGYNYNNYTFGAMSWNLKLAAAAAASADTDTLDIVQIDTNAFFSIRSVSNLNTAVKARILFNGGTYYMHNRMATPLFAPVVDSEIILEGINGNDINIMRMEGGVYALTGYGSGAAPTGYLRFRGSGNVILNGTGGNPNILPGLAVTERCSFEQGGDLIVKGCMTLKLSNSNRLPYGPDTGNVVLQDAESTLNFAGCLAPVNGLLGCGAISNGSTKAMSTLIINIGEDKLCSELISKDLTWLDSMMGIECVKRGKGLILADSMPSAPKLTIESGGVKTTSAATLETMKGETVEFKAGTSLSVAGGIYTAKNTIFGEGVQVSISAGGVYRAQDGDSTLYSPTVAAGGIIEKTGGGMLTIHDSDTAFAGTIRAMDGGTIRLVGNADDESIGLASTAVLRADAGATIDLSAVAEGGAQCGGLEFDYAHGGGVITRFEPASNGVLAITNWPEDLSIGGFELPLTFGSVAGASNLSTWKLVVNGVEKSNRIAFIDGKICIQRKGTILVVR